jgi:monothiol glutaredoxin
MNKQIEHLVNSSDVFLFMKGEPARPMCRFSAQVIAILNMYDVKFNSFNILEDMEMREAIKSYSNWPTYPQLYMNGKFVGGCDIITEIHENGEFEELLKSSKAKNSESTADKSSEDARA